MALHHGPYAARRIWRSRRPRETPGARGHTPDGANMTRRYIRFFDEIGVEDVPLVGGKNASLGEMYRNLSSQGVRVPNGFAITAEAYSYVLQQARALGPLHDALDNLRMDDVGDLARRARRAREIVYGAPL